MSEAADVGRIRPEGPPPPDAPDANTAAEERDQKRKPPTATEREAASHYAHIQTWKAHVEYHCGENEKLQAEILLIRREKDGYRQRVENLAVRCERLESTSGFAALINLLGLALTLLGPGLISHAGSAPGLNDQERTGYCWAGWAVLGCGILVLAFTQLAAIWMLPSKQRSAGRS